MSGPELTFEAFRLDPRSGDLRRGEELVKLTPRAAAVLAMLVEQAPQLVTKDDLLARAWNGKAVGDEALTSCIQELRRALGDDARRPHFIETRHRRGYRFLVPASRATDASRTTTAAWASGMVDKPSVAVLPFDNLSPDPDQEYFADGLVEDMTAALSRVGSLLVVARASSFTFKGRNVTVQQVGRELGVRYIVKGSVRRAQGRLRIAAQLVEAGTGHQLWADRYDGDLADVFELQDRAVASIVGVLVPSLQAAEIDRARLKRPDSLQAYDYVLRAYRLKWSLADPGHLEALGLFHKAFELEPRYAIAMAEAAWAHGQRCNNLIGADPESHRPRAMALAEAALDLDSDDPGVLLAAGTALFLAGPASEVERCELLFRKALSLDPNSATGWHRMGMVHTRQQRPEDAIHAYEQARRLNPLSPVNAYLEEAIATAHLMAGRLPQAMVFWRRAVADRPHDAYLRRRLCSVLALAGELDEARQMARDLMAEHPEVTLAHLASVTNRLGETSRQLVEGWRLAGFR